MTPEQMERLFQPFQQADASISARYGGTGLGLTICKRFAELLGGVIAVESRAGQGTEFCVELPAIYGEAVAVSTPVMGSADGPLVLVIDDDPMIHDLFSRALWKEGFRTILAADAEEGVRLAGELHPDAILLDLMLGGSDGWTVMGRLREGKSAEEAPPVILMSILDERRKGLALGADGFLVKPVQRQQLKQALDSVLVPRNKAVPRALIVDDEPVNRLLLRRMLQDQGWSVSEGANGREGLEIVNRERLAVVLLDPITPVRDGLEFLLDLRAHPEAADLPVFVIVAKNLSETERRSLDESVAVLLAKRSGAGEHQIGEQAAGEIAARLRNKVKEHAENIAG